MSYDEARLREQKLHIRGSADDRVLFCPQGVSSCLADIRKVAGGHLMIKEVMTNGGARWRAKIKGFTGNLGIYGALDTPIIASSSSL